MKDDRIVAFRRTTEIPDLKMFEMHTQESYEIFCFLSGNAEYYVEGTIYPLEPGDILILKKAEAHSLLIGECIPYERIVVHFYQDHILGDLSSELQEFLDNRPLGKFNRYPAASFRNPHWLYLLNQLTSTKCAARRIAYLNTLLWELYDAYPKLCVDKDSTKESMADVIQYINEHLTENLSVPMLCDNFFVSKPQLNRKFKKATGSSVWNYIVTKRLHMAKDLMLNGCSPSDACVKSGFNDYSSFYRTYRAHFGVSPKENLRR